MPLTLVTDDTFCMLPAVVCVASSRHAPRCTRTAQNGARSSLSCSAVGIPLTSHGRPSLNRRTSRKQYQVSALFGREGSAGGQSSSSSASSTSATPSARRNHQVGIWHVDAKELSTVAGPQTGTPASYASHALPLIISLHMAISHPLFSAEP
jgi:hypothetical protein